MEIGFNERIVDYGDVLRRVRWKLIWSPLIAENSHVVVVVKIKHSELRGGQCTNP